MLFSGSLPLPPMLVTRRIRSSAEVRRRPPGSLSCMSPNASHFYLAADEHLNPRVSVGRGKSDFRGCGTDCGSSHDTNFEWSDSAQRERERALPAFVEREFRSFLTCGVLEYGFLRLRCTQCGNDRLLPYSCKCRGYCPSCCGRGWRIPPHILSIA